jgi:3'(2'), 5'-bisphosphate nucleotidase
MRGALCDLVRKAGHKILEIYERDDFQVQLKSDQSPLTLADRASHQLILEELQTLTPDVPVISEEGDLPDHSVRKDYERFWLVDPLDGTKEFIKRNGEFTINIALIEKYRPVLGIVGVPVQGLIYYGDIQHGCFLESEIGSARALRAPRGTSEQRLRCAVSRSHPSEALSQYLTKFPDLTCRSLGSSLKFCKVAEGEVDFYPRFGPLKEWDTAAAHAVAAAAGARVTDLTGKNLVYNREDLTHPNLMVAANPELHRQLLGMVD